MNNIITSSEIAETAKLYQNIRCVTSRIGDFCRIGDNCDIVDCIMDEKSELGRRNILRDVTIGKGTYTGTDCILKHTRIGRYSSIAWNVNISGGNHPYTHTSMYTDYWFKRTFGAEINDVRDEKLLTIIGNDCWIGMGVNIISGVHIGDGAVIGAGSVIAKDVPPYAVVVGSPGRVIKYRFDSSIIEMLLNLKWWEWDEGFIKEHIDFLRQEPTKQRIEQIEALLH